MLSEFLIILLKLVSSVILVVFILFGFVLSFASEKTEKDKAIVFYVIFYPACFPYF